MRTARWLALTILSLPSLAAAQVYIPAPPFPPHVEVQGRVYFQWGRRRPAPPTVYFAPPPPPVYIAPPPPVVYQPPVYAPPPPPVEPYPTYAPAYPSYAPVYPSYAPAYPSYAPPPPPAMAAPVLLQRAVKPQWTSRLGLGATYEGLLSVDTGSKVGMGFLGQLRYRAARHLSLELMSGYERTTADSGALRTDVPITFGLLIPFLGPEHVFSPYVVAAGGVNFADLHMIDTPGFKLDDSRTQLIGQVGGGLELRLGQHFALNGDVRLEGRWNTRDASPEVRDSTVKVDGKPVVAISDTVGLRLGVGATVYF